MNVFSAESSQGIEKIMPHKSLDDVILRRTFFYDFCSPFTVIVTNE
jgi:hypothetical protein